MSCLMDVNIHLFSIDVFFLLSDTDRSFNVETKPPLWPHIALFTSVSPFSFPSVDEQGQILVHWPEGWRFDPSVPHSACKSVLGQDTEPKLMFVWMAEWQSCDLKCSEYQGHASREVGGIYRVSRFILWRPWIRNSGDMFIWIAVYI